MTDKELLEMAAKASGIAVRWNVNPPCTVMVDEVGDAGYWNPLADDGDALRLAVDLDMGVEVMRSLATVRVGNGEQEAVKAHWNLKDVPDAYTATRRAIVRAAAEIGKAMP